jgi:Cu+-exporting ATPase
MADRISRIFVPIVVILTLTTWAIWFTHTYTQAESEALDLGGMSKFHFAFSFGISTLVIACPCALGLATPTAVMVGTGVAASYGILIKGGDVLEKISSINTIVFDKTGTLTNGTPLVKDVIQLDGDKEETLQLFLAYLCEKSSEHPLAKSIVNKIQAILTNETIANYNKKFEVKEFKNREGEGVSAIITDESKNETLDVSCGNLKLLHSLSIKNEDLEE